VKAAAGDAAQAAQNTKEKVAAAGAAAGKKVPKPKKSGGGLCGCFGRGAAEQDVPVGTSAEAASQAAADDTKDFNIPRGYTRSIHHLSSSLPSFSFGVASMGRLCLRPNADSWPLLFLSGVFFFCFASIGRRRVQDGLR
jgi:hypothetical protein